MLELWEHSVATPDCIEDHVKEQLASIGCRLASDGDEFVCPSHAFSDLVDILRRPRNETLSLGECDLDGKSLRFDSDQPCVDAEADGNNAIARQAMAEKTISTGRRITDHVIESLTHACSTTERAAMAIGDQISALFEIARTNNESASESISGVIGRNTQSSSDVLSEDAQRVISIAALLENQRRGIESFVQKTQEFFQQHTQLANESEERIQKMESSVSTISKIAVGSRILAINAQIESARLGEAGRAFAVVSKQMKSFSDDTKNANNLIDASVASVSDLMSRVRSGTREMESSLSEFATVLAAEVEEIETRTDTLMELLSNTLCQIEESNVHLTASSRTALSELQFQDPLSQNLQRMVHDVKKLQSLLETGECEDFDLAEIDPTVGNDGSLEREAGEIEFF